MIVAQVRAVADDIGVDAVKIGMVGTAAAIEAVAQALDELAPGTPVVLDPVMVSESGGQLLEPSARSALVEQLLPARDSGDAEPATRRARSLGRDPREAAPGEDVAELARDIKMLGPAVVVITGGHREHAVDVFYDGAQLVEIPGERYPDGAAHGSGCTHSSTLAARLARGDTPLAAARTAKRRASQAVRDGLADLGAGPGPVDVLGVT